MKCSGCGHGNELHSNVKGVTCQQCSCRLNRAGQGSMERVIVAFGDHKTVIYDPRIETPEGDPL